jgi:spore maturation protein SpmA
MDFIGRDPGRNHFYISLWKSATRIMGCAFGLFGMLEVLAGLFLLAEIFGIVEEIA